MTLVLTILFHLCWSCSPVSSSESNLGRKKERQGGREGGKEIIGLVSVEVPRWPAVGYCSL